MQLESFFICRHDSGAVLPFGKCFVYVTGTTTPVSLFNGSGGGIANPAIADANGMVQFAAADGTYDLVFQSSDGVYTGPTLSKFQIFDLSNAGASAVTVASRSSLAGISTPANNTMRYLAEAGREGWFKFSTANQSSLVSVDTRQGQYVAPTADTTGASGAWIRIVQGSANVKWWGCAADDSTDDSGAFIGALATLKALAINTVSTWYKGGSSLYVPLGNYYMAANPIDVTFTVTIYGEDKSFGVATSSTKLRWAPGTSGFRFQSYNSSGDTTTTSGTGFTGSDGSIIRGLCLMGGLQTTSTEGEYHGIHTRAIINIEDVTCQYWQGDGFHINGDVTVNGNVSTAQVWRCLAAHVRNGFYVQGGDANVVSVISCSAIYCRRWGYWDSGFLGNRFQGCHASGCGIFNVGYTPCVAAIGGMIYGVVHGQETGASTNAPPSSTVTITIASPGVVTWNSHGLKRGNRVAFSTTGALPTGLSANTAYYIVNPTTNTFQVSATLDGTAINTSGSQSGTHTAGAGMDNAYWLWCGASAPDTISLNYVPWTTGLTWRSGGGYLNDHAGAPSTFDDCYNEGGDPPDQLGGLSLAIGGLKGSSMRGAYVYGNAGGGGLTSRDGMTVIDDSSPYGNKTIIGSGSDPTTGILTVFNTVALNSPGMAIAWPAFDPTNLYWTMYRTYYGNDAVPVIVSNYTASLSVAPWGAARFNFPQGFGLAGKKVYSGTAAPTSGTYNQGDMVFNSAPAAAGKIGWVCTTGGTPGTWKAWGVIDA